MNDLTNYVCDSMKSCEGPDVEFNEVINQKTRNGVKKKNGRKNTRNRGKIKITQTNGNCEEVDDINRKNDIINETSGVFDLSSDEAKIVQMDDSTEELIASSCQENEEIQIEDDEIDLDTTNESIFSVGIKSSEERFTTDIGVIADKREESNAFHVLMPRINRDDLKLKLKQNNDKSSVLSNRKSCSKRKFSEDGEEKPEKIKKPFQHHSKSFDYDDDIKNCNKTNQPATNRKLFTHGLHNYFSKIKSEGQEEEASSLVVKTDIPKTKTRQVLAAIDDIKILQSDTSSSLPVQAILLEQTLEERPQSELKKPKWSLRINLQSSVQNCDGDYDGDVVDKEERRLKNRVKGKEKGTRREINSYGNKQKLEEKKDINEAANVNTNNVVDNTDNSSLVSNNNFHDKIIEINEVKTSLNDKLAPLFTKRSKPDPKVIEARRTFLHSRSSENRKSKSERKSQISTMSTMSLPFPLIAHVTQLNIDTRVDNSLNCIKYRDKPQVVHVTQLNPINLKYVNSPTKNNRKYSIPAKKSCKITIEKALQDTEQRCTDAREMWRTISTIKNKLNRQLSPKKNGSKRKSTDKEIHKVENRNIYDTWTQKYRPLNSREIAGNEDAAMKLRNWLKTWKLSVSEDIYSSGDEFYCSDNSCKNSAENQIATLLGPYGSGKTASVYAIAEELGYTVIEVNASSKRSGRKILKELEEATKSHRVKQNDLKSIARPMLNANKNIPENSLILIEDVDLIFDEDEGFISAINQLASNTKRPIAMTCRDSCSHLNRMAPQQLKIYFQKISNSRAIALMELITIAETGSPISYVHLEKLMACGDLRKALLQLQYLLVSGLSHSLEISSNFQETLWQDMRRYLYKPIVQINKEQMKKDDKNEQIEETTIPRQDINLIISLANDLDTVSLISSLIEINDPTLNISQLKFEPSLSLEENMDLYSNKNVLSTKISEWLGNRIMYKYIGSSDKTEAKILNQLLIKKESNKNVNLSLSQVSMYTLDNRILSMDYLPTVRTICRAEDVKANNNIKRGRRFFHYLQNFRLPSASVKSNILIAACKIMQEKTDKLLQS